MTGLMWRGGENVMFPPMVLCLIGSILHAGFVGLWCVVLMYCIMMHSVVY